MSAVHVGELAAMPFFQQLCVEAPDCPLDIRVLAALAAAQRVEPAEVRFLADLIAAFADVQAQMAYAAVGAAVRRVSELLAATVATPEQPA